MLKESMRNRYCAYAAACLTLFGSSPILCRAQVSFQAAVTLALLHSPKLKAAQNDVDKAKVNLSVLKDIFIPSVVTSGGVGATSGITLTVPTIFTVNAQSLIFSFQQRAYIRAGHSEMDAARLALAEARAEVQEDAVITYLTIDQAQTVIAVLNEQYGFAQKLIAIDEDRERAGLENDLEVMKARRGAVQIDLQRLRTEDALESSRAHLAELTGLSADAMETDSKSIPALPPAASIEDRSGQAGSRRAYPESPAILAAEANVSAKEQRARGDSEYTWRPLVTFGAQYGRVSPINNVSDFYNLHGDYNTANVGIQLQLPILDRVRRGAAMQSLVDASRARLDLDNLRADQAENLNKLERSVPELEAKAKLAELDFEIAQNELNATTIQLHGVTGKPPLTPKEEATAHIEERQRYLDMLDAKLQAAKANVTFIRQTGQLSAWIDSLMPVGESRTGTAAQAHSR